MRIRVAEDEVLTAMALQLVLQAGEHEVLGPVASMEHGLDTVALEALLDLRSDSHLSGRAC